MSYLMQLNELYILLQKQASKAIFKEFFYERMLQTIWLRLAFNDKNTIFSC